MYFSPRSPYVQILCHVGENAAADKIETVRVNHELIPSPNWQVANTDLIIYVPERVVHFNLSRFPDIEVMLTADHASANTLL
jgi:hypothetical protein